MAIKEALLWAKNFHSVHILLESDCVNAVTTINDAGPNVHWVNQGIVNEIKHLLSTIVGVSLNYVTRSGNNVAHKIANRES